MYKPPLPAQQDCRARAWVCTADISVSSRSTSMSMVPPSQLATAFTIQTEELTINKWIQMATTNDQGVLLGTVWQWYCSYFSSDWAQYPNMESSNGLPLIKIYWPRGLEFWVMPVMPICSSHPHRKAQWRGKPVVPNPTGASVWHLVWSSVCVCAESCRSQGIRHLKMQKTYDILRP